MYLSLNNRFIQKLSELLIVNHFFAKNTVAYFFSQEHMVMDKMHARARLVLCLHSLLRWRFFPFSLVNVR